ncbi:hypothetical protein OF83DRAFT_1084747 [Amylostereum chailletii]|nr:hypothetical protein OF83DRAFT_1084747 [Amylostereum chailletii]
MSTGVLRTALRSPISPRLCGDHSMSVKPNAQQVKLVKPRCIQFRPFRDVWPLQYRPAALTQPWFESSGALEGMHMTARSNALGKDSDIIVGDIAGCLECIQTLSSKLCMLHNLAVPAVSLPREILTGIFDILVDIFPIKTFGDRTIMGWIAITMACRQWREVTVGYPVMWARSFAELPGAPHRFLHRAQEVGLNIVMQPRQPYVGANGAAVDAMVSHFPSARRINVTTDHVLCPLDDHIAAHLSDRLQHLVLKHVRPRLRQARGTAHSSYPLLNRRTGANDHAFSHPSTKFNSLAIPPSCMVSIHGHQVWDQVGHSDDGYQTIIPAIENMFDNTVSFRSLLITWMAFNMAHFELTTQVGKENQVESSSMETSVSIQMERATAWGDEEDWENTGSRIMRSLCSSKTIKTLHLHFHVEEFHYNVDWEHVLAPFSGITDLYLYSSGTDCGLILQTVAQSRLLQLEPAADAVTGPSVHLVLLRSSDGSIRLDQA